MIKPFAGERYAYRRVKSDAAAVRREFTITLDWFILACHMPCHYCGRVDGNSISVKSRGIEAGFIVKDFRYNGLDRVDNSKGYTLENCVPCCAVCNRAKNTMTYDEFREYLDDLVNFRNTGEYHEPFLRAVPLPVSERGSEAGDAVKTQYATGGYVSSDRDRRRYVSSGCVVRTLRDESAHWVHTVNSQEKESAQED